MRLRRAAPILALLFIAVMVALEAWRLHLAHPVNSLDGAMQTWFAVSNFAAGRQLGVDFQSYLGVTMMLALVPLFGALGGTLWASSVAAEIATAAGVVATLYGIARLMRWPSPAVRWLIVAGGYALLTLWGWGVDPGYSLRPIRWSLPFCQLIALFPLLRFSLVGSPGTAGAWAGVVLGIGLLWSNDSGIPAFGAFCVAILACHWGHWRRAGSMLGAMVATSIVTAALILLAVTHGEPSGWLHYNFVAVRGDQSWFFGPWTREHRILEIGDLIYLVAVLLLFPVDLFAFLLLAAGMLVTALRIVRGQGARACQAAYLFVGLSAMGAAFLPQVGGHLDQGYNGAFRLIGYASPFILFARPMMAAGRRWHPMARSALVALLVGASIGVLAMSAARQLRPSDQQASAIANPALGLRVSPERAAEFAAMERLASGWDRDGVPTDRRMLSVYTSMVDISLGDAVRAPTPYGSIIHALGPQARLAYVERVEQREVAAVTTIAPDFAGSGRWNMRACWPFFRALARNYEPVARTDQHVLWLRREEAREAASKLDCTVEADGSRAVIIRVSGGGPGFADLELEIDAPGDRPLVIAREDSATLSEAGPRERWRGQPYYGVPPAPVARLVLELAGDAPSVRLERLDPGTLDVRGCKARLVRWPDLDALPALADFDEAKPAARD